MKTPYVMRLAVFWCATFLIAGALVAQAGGSKPTKSANAPAKGEEKKDDDDKKKDRWLHIHNVDVYPVAGPIRRRAEILVKNEKIEAIGRNLDVPEDAEKLDGMGFRAYPGLVALNGSGIVPRASGKIEDTSHPSGLWNILALAHGITTVITGTTAVKVQMDSIENYVLRKSLYLAMAYSARNPRAKVQLRSDLRKAFNFLRQKRSGEKKSAKTTKSSAKGGAKSASSKKPKKAASAQKQLGGAARYLPLLEGKTTAVFNVSSTQEIRDVCDLVRTFGFRTVIRGAVHGWTVPGDMGRAGVMAIVSPRDRDDPDDGLNRPTGSTVANAAILHQHGVRVAISSIGNTVDLDGSPGRDAVSLAFDAGAAVGGGLPNDEAIRAITHTAAQCYQLDDRVGSLEVGKDADIIIVDGELLHYATHVQWAIVNGKLCYDKEKESLLRSIRSRNPKKEKDNAPWWPRPFAEMPDSWTYDPAKVAAEREAAKKKEDGEKKGDEKKEPEDKKPADAKDKGDDDKATKEKAKGDEPVKG